MVGTFCKLGSVLSTKIIRIDTGLKGHYGVFKINAIIDAHQEIVNIFQKRFLRMHTLCGAVPWGLVSLVYDTSEGIRNRVYVNKYQRPVPEYYYYVHT